MKRILILLLMCVVLAGCDTRIYPQTYPIILETCEKNEGLMYFDYIGGGPKTDEILVKCNDGAEFKLKYEYVYTEFKNDEGEVTKTWVDSKDHTWKVVK